MIANDFERFHRENPQVYSVLVKLAREWVGTGRRKLGIKSLYERARWEIQMSTTDLDYKLNNNYHAFYARLIMYEEPDLDELFDLRASEADEWFTGYVARSNWRRRLDGQGPL